MSKDKDKKVAQESVGAQIPKEIANNPDKLKLWEEATQDVRDAADLLITLERSRVKNEIEPYFDFYDAWIVKFPPTGKNRRNAYGENCVEAVSGIVGFKSSAIYEILKTAALYGRAGWKALNGKAAANGVFVYWSHLKTVANRLGDPKHKDVRTKVEAAIVSQQYSVSKLNQYIDHLVPEIARIGSAAGAANVDGTISDDEVLLPHRKHETFIVSLVTQLSTVKTKANQYRTALANFDAELNMNDEEHIQRAKTLVQSLRDSMEEVEEFLRSERPTVVHLLEALEIATNAEAEVVQNVKAKLSNAKKQAAQSYQERQQKAAQLNYAVADDYEEDEYEEDDAPILETADDEDFDPDQYIESDLDLEELDEIVS
jgi:hypothetical protein